ncbi:MAG: hypothetical protein IT581_02420 [Verrucomicrobiales bacterium]|nr:hypothetical protein [Verrucomicrobiales bacterium]
MKTNSTSTTTPEDLARGFERELANADGGRVAALDGLSRLRAAKTVSLQREHARLLERYGKDDARVTRLEQKQSANQRFVGVLGAVAAQARVATITAAPGTFVLHGFVRDQSLRGLVGLTVRLVDVRGRWIEAYGNACTDADGYFVLLIREFQGRVGATEADGVANAKIGDRMQVLDAKGQSLYLGKESVPVREGQVEYREVILDGSDCGCSPEPSDPSTGLSGSPGTVTSAPANPVVTRPPTAQPTKPATLKRRKPPA